MRRVLILFALCALVALVLTPAASAAPKRTVTGDFYNYVEQADYDSDGVLETIQHRSVLTAQEAFKLPGAKNYRAESGLFINGYWVVEDAVWWYVVEETLTDVVVEPHEVWFTNAGGNRWHAVDGGKGYADDTVEFSMDGETGYNVPVLGRPGITVKM